eukprot:m.8020 g.8020  ORF g.8020 m.8020 type:complete len:379 (-) comp3820_c0_seq2:203-1339(-)
MSKWGRHMLSTFRAAQIRWTRSLTIPGSTSIFPQGLGENSTSGKPPVCDENSIGESKHGIVFNDNVHVKASTFLHQHMQSQQNVGDTLMPESLNLLIQNEIPVPPERLLDLDWETLLKKSAGQHELHGHIKTQYERIKKMKALNEFKIGEQKLQFDTKHAKSIFETFVMWQNILQVSDLLSMPKSSLLAIDEVLAPSKMGLTTVQEKLNKVKELAEKGETERAQQLSERTVKSLDRINNMLLMYKAELEAKEAALHEQAMVQFHGAGAFLFATAGLASASYFLPEQSENCIAGAGATGCIAGILLSSASVDYFKSKEFGRYALRVVDAQKERLRISNEIEEVVDDILFNPSHDAQVTSPDTEQMESDGELDEDIVLVF